MRTLTQLATGIFVATLITTLFSAEASAQTSAQNGMQTPAAAGNMSATPFVPRSSGPLNWGAFVDVTTVLPNKRDPVSSRRGFALNDAALYLSRDMNFGSVVVDLPFYSTTGGTDNSFAFASRQAQGFVQFNAFQPLSVRLGQYDTFFGFERNDSRDRFFAHQGLFKTILLPQTHAGAQIAYGRDALTVLGQITNPNGQGTMRENDNVEVGAQIRYGAGQGYGALGFSLNESRRGVLPAEPSTNMIVDFLGGFQADNLSLDGELLLTKTSSVDKSGFGLGAMAVFQTSPQLALGARLEYAKDIPMALPQTVVPGGYGLMDSVLNLSAGPSYRFDNDFLVRGDFTLTNIKPNGGSEISDFGLTLSLLANL